MYKKLIALTLSLTALLTFASCSALDSILDKVPGKDASSQTDKNQNLKIGDKSSTLFFDFTVISATSVDEFAGIVPEEGKQLIDVVVKSTNTFTDDIEMYDTDFQLQWDGGDDAYSNTIEAIDDTMAPYTHLLVKGDSMEFHYIYEAPADVTDFQLAHLEEIIYDDGEEEVGEFFLVHFSV